MRHDTVLLRLAGLSALTGAALRAAAAFPRLRVPILRPEALYLTIDLLLTLGLIGLFGGIARFRGWLGVLGFVGAVAGLELIRTGERLGGGEAYQRSSAALALSLAVAGVALVREPGLARYAGGAWIASFVVGLAGTALHWAPAFQAASLLFCAGFALGGLVLLVEGGA
jgi:hypothetical protein